MPGCLFGENGAWTGWYLYKIHDKQINFLFLDSDLSKINFQYKKRTSYYVTTY